MSSYIVDPATIGRIIAFLADDDPYRSVNYDFHTAGYLRKKLTDAGYSLGGVSYEPKAPESHIALAEAMNAMNASAYHQRYPNTKDECSPFVYVPQPVPNPIQAFKSLQCFLYQCAEGDVPQRNLYRVLDKIRNALAVAIVESLPLYDQANWE